MIRLCISESCLKTLRDLPALTWEALDVFLGHLIDDPWDPGVDCTICHPSCVDFALQGQEEITARFLPDYAVCWSIPIPQEARGWSKGEIRERAKRCEINLDVQILHVFKV